MVEDTPTLSLLYKTILTRAGHTVHAANDAGEGLEAFSTLHPPVVLLDLSLPDRDGLELMADCLRMNGMARFVVVTAHGSINRAVDAMRAGAYEFLVKPFDETRLLNAVENARRAAEGERLRSSRDTSTRLRGFNGLIGSSRIMQSIYREISEAGRSMAPVMISGEPGTGKAMAARAIHAASDRAKSPFVMLDCAAMNPNTIAEALFGSGGTGESEWQGGAASSSDGDATPSAHDQTQFEACAALRAHGGTLVLHSVCEMPPTCQRALLRFLESQSLRAPLEQPGPLIKVDVRVIASSRLPPDEAVRRGQLDADLLGRLRVFAMQMPPLRLRGDDVIEIAEARLHAMAKAEGRDFTRLSPEVAELFSSAAWPGNVRQLVNVLRAAVVLNDGPQLTSAMLSVSGQAPRDGTLAADGLANLSGLTLAEIERRVIEAAIARHSGSVPKAAEELGVAPSTLYRKRETWSDPRP